MCQWKFFVFKYSAKTSAKIAFIAPEISLVASRVRSVRVSSGASRLWTSSAFLGIDLAMVWPSFGWVVFISQDNEQRSSATLAERYNVDSLFQGTAAQRSAGRLVAPQARCQIGRASCRERVKIAVGAGS